MPKTLIQYEPKRRETVNLLNTEELLLNEAAGDSVAAAPNADAATADSTPDLSGADVDLQSLLPKVDDNGNV